MPNLFSGFVNKVNRTPEFMRSYLLTKLFCTKVKYAGTSGVKLIKVSAQEVELKLANKKKVQNHIGGIHAAAMALLAETATGFVFGMSVPDSKLTVIKKMNIDYVKRSTGAMRAVATLSDAQISKIKNETKGHMVVTVLITDDANIEPIKAEMTWAWTAKRK